MEPFGLLNLLKSLLPQTENITQNPETNTDKGAPVFTAETPTNDTRPLPFSEESPTGPPPVTPSTDTFLDFVSRHDARAKNVKKR